MKINVVFVNGPLHRIKADVEYLPAVNTFLDNRDRIVHAYVRDELEYYYDPVLSKALTPKYDEIMAKARKGTVDPTGDA